MAGKQPEEQERNPADHLKDHRFKPGQSGNPSGRPKGRINLHARLEKALLKELADGTIEADQVVKALIREMKLDPVKMTTFILKMIDRDEGPVANNINLSTEFTFDDVGRYLDELDAGSPGRG